VNKFKVAADAEGEAAEVRTEVATPAAGSRAEAAEAVTALAEVGLEAGVADEINVRSCGPRIRQRSNSSQCG
jgi:hypothetical protein